MTEPTLFYRLEDVKGGFTYEDPWGREVTVRTVRSIVEVVPATKTEGLDAQVFTTMMPGSNGQMSSCPVYVSDDGRRFYKVEVGDYSGSNGAALELTADDKIIAGRWWRAGRLSPYERYIDPNGQPIRVRNPS